MKNVKKNTLYLLTTAVLLSLSTFFQACTPEEVEAENSITQQMQVFATKQDAIFNSVNQELGALKNPEKIKFKHLFAQAIQTVESPAESLNMFEASYMASRTQMSTQTLKSETVANPEMAALMYSSHSYDDASDKVQNLLNSMNEDHPQYPFLLTMQDILEFLKVNQEILGPYFLDDSKNKRAKTCGWWESWGNALLEP